jgi:DNA repair protein RadC
MGIYSNHKLTIKSWAEEDRPREKLQLKGKKALSDAELLAIILGSGNRETSALGLAQQILHSVQGDLHALTRKSVTELTKFPGVGSAKAIAIVAALELGSRRQLLDVKKRPQVRSSQDAYEAIATLVHDLDHEEFWILLLDRANQILGRERISTGGVSGTLVDAKIIFRKALEYQASGIILCHNHPSGNLKPSQADIDLTRKLRKAGDNVDILVMDHMIIAESGYYSFADEGIL